MAQLEQRLERATARLVAGRSALAQVAAAAPASAPGTTPPAAARAGGVNSGPATEASGEALDTAKLRGDWRLCYQYNAREATKSQKAFARTGLPHPPPQQRGAVAAGGVKCGGGA